MKPCNHVAMKPSPDVQQVRGRKRQQEDKRIKPVQHTAVAGEQGTGVLDTEAALEHGLNEVADAAEHSDDGRKYHPVLQPEFVRYNTKKIADQKGDGHAAQGAFPCFLRGNAGQQRCFAKQGADEVSARVVHPSEQQQAEDGPDVEAVAIEGDEIEQ